ncbi:MAG: hypothetical protein WD556_08140 [Actinomycetota bacterium]
MIEGQLFSDHVPEELRGELPMPPMGSGPKETTHYEEAFNRRARYRYQRHVKPDADGATRWRCPFSSGYLRSRAIPHTMRRAPTVPLVDLPEGSSCCPKTITASAEDLVWWQTLPPGTTAWRRSMGRRQVAEAANAGLKGGFVNIERKNIRVMGLVKTAVMLTFSVVGYNLDRIRSFLARAKASASAKPVRARRRTGTLPQLLGHADEVASGRDPPPD